MIISKMAALVITSAFLLSGCNTVAGVGKDVEKVGEKTQEVSKDVSKKISDKK